MSETVTTVDSLNSLLQNELVLLDMWAPWCKPCLAVAPILESIESEVPNLKVLKVNVDDFVEVAQTYDVRSIPTLILFKNGVECDRMVGANSKAKILEFINKKENNE